MLFHALENFPPLITFPSSFSHIGNLYKIYCAMLNVISYAIVIIESCIAEQSGIDVFIVTNYGISDNLLMR